MRLNIDENVILLQKKLQELEKSWKKGKENYT